MIGDLIRKIRLEHKDSLEELGEKVDYNFSNLSKIERGTRRPSVELLEKIADVYGVHISYFFGIPQNVPELLESKGVEWISFVDEMEKRNLSPEELRKVVEFLDSMKKE